MSRRGAAPIDVARLARMRDTLLHRGPDGAGLQIFDGGRAGLAHRRLSILDLSPRAAQPMADPSGRYWVTFNGEIYNFRELRTELEAHGHTFRSDGDTEVLVAAYAEWGEACVERLRGMWAFAIWDEKEKTLFCSRDRFGIKPFYYYDDGDLFVFASEIRAILAGGRPAPEPCPSSLAAYLATPAVVDGLEETFFQGVRRLPPAHALTISPAGTRRRRYWDLDLAAVEGGSRPERELRDRLDAAVRSHLVSDVPVGVALSGGLDSTSVLVLATRATGPGLPVYSSWYPYRFWDERRWTERVVEQCEAEATYLQPTPEGFLETLPRIIWHLEEPPLLHGVYSRWCVAERASRDVTVLLSGQGSDELLAGYTRYDVLLQRDYLARGRLLRFAREFRSAASRWGVVQAAKVLRQDLGVGDPEPDFALGERLRDVSPPQRRAPGIDPRNPVNALNRRLYYDITCHPLPQLLRYDDKLIMAHSVECRVPFLDHPLAEFAFSLPPWVKIRDGWRKLALRRAMDGDLPKQVQWRRGKRPFGMPYDEWLSGPLLPEIASRILEGPAVQDGWLDLAAVERTVKCPAPAEANPLRTQSIVRWLWLTAWLESHGALTDRRNAAAPLARRWARSGEARPRE